MTETQRSKEQGWKEAAEDFSVDSLRAHCKYYPCPVGGSFLRCFGKSSFFLVVIKIRFFFNVIPTQKFGLSPTSLEGNNFIFFCFQSGQCWADG